MNVFKSMKNAMGAFFGFIEFLIFLVLFVIQCIIGIALFLGFIAVIGWAFTLFW